MTELNLLPGPVPLSPRVQAALQLPPRYHRCAEFIETFECVRERLAALIGRQNVALFVGSGTLANDVIGATLASASFPGRGMILNNGEFGRRLVAQARRFRLRPRVLTWPWGRPWDLDQVGDALDHALPGSWIWGVHHESSTGVLNDLPGLANLARRRNVRVCVDAVSSIGGLPLDLSQVFLASGTSGKALGALAGVAIVFADRLQLETAPRGPVPACLDLRAALTRQGPQFTFPSPLIHALAAALEDIATPALAWQRFAALAEAARRVRLQLRAAGLPPLAEETSASPLITTFQPPDGWSSADFVEICRGWGYLPGGQSAYLAQRRLVQIATMSPPQTVDLAPLWEHWRALLQCHRTAASAGRPAAAVTSRA